jgi:tellurium resistance protein TerD
MSTWWRAARRADLGLDDNALAYKPFTITNRAWYVLYQFLKSLGVQGLETLAGDDVLVPTNLAHHWGNAILSADMDKWFQLGEFDGEAVVPIGIVHESTAPQYINTHELVSLGGSAIGAWLYKIGQELAIAPSGLVISSRRRQHVAVELEKRGSKANLTDLAKQTDGSGNTIPPKLVIGLSWNARKTQGDPYDLDGSVVGLDDNDLSVGGDWFCYYNNKSTPGGVIRHLKGDNLTGDGEGDDEQSESDLAQIPAHLTKLDILITIHKAVERKQSFAEVSNAVARIFDPATATGGAPGTDLVRVKLTDDADEDANAARIAQIYRTDDGAWNVKKFGDFYTGELKGLVDTYKIA